jgi:cell division protein ZapB
MPTDHQKDPTLDELHRLESLVDEMVRSCSRLRDENRSLRAQCKSLQGERSQLIEKNEVARNRVDAMITHLKSMEQG